jgi:hypothetical protein
MSKGSSGRLVVEMDPEIKRQLYSVLAEEGLTFKEWVVRQAELLIRERREPQLPGVGRRSSDV